MSKAFNLSLLANNVNSAGQLDGAGVNGPVAESSTLTTANFIVQQSGSKLIFYYNSTPIASLDSSGNFVSLADSTAFGTP